MDLYSKYKRINKSKGNDIREINKCRVANDFQRILDTSANSYDIKYYEVEDIKRRHFEEDRIVIDDGAKVAETTSVDVKKVLCKTSSKIGIGTYINWRNIDWLIISEDVTTTGAYKKFSMLPCNLYITKRVEGRIVDYPVAYENINSNAFNQEIGANSSKFIIDISMEKIIIPNIDEIREITALNKRVMINGEKVYKVKKEDTFQTKGVVYVTIQQDVTSDKDNTELNIADDIGDVLPPIIEPMEDSLTIEGDSIAKIGSRKEYEILTDIQNDVYEPVKVEVVSAYDNDTLIEDLIITDDKVSFKVKKDTKNINKKLKIKAVSKVKDYPAPLIYPDLEPEFFDLEEEFEVTIKGII